VEESTILKIVVPMVLLLLAMVALSAIYTSHVDNERKHKAAIACIQRDGVWVRAVDMCIPLVGKKAPGES